MPSFFREKKSQLYSKLLDVPLVVCSGCWAVTLAVLVVLAFEGVRIGQKRGMVSVKRGESVVNKRYYIHLIDLGGLTPPSCRQQAGLCCPLMRRGRVSHNIVLEQKPLCALGVGCEYRFPAPHTWILGSFAQARARSARTCFPCNMYEVFPPLVRTHRRQEVGTDRQTKERIIP